MKPTIQSRLSRIFRFSHSCFLCGQMHREKTLCESCQKLLPCAGIFCQICGITLTQSGICGQCLKQTPIYQRVLPCFWYEEPLQTLIQEYKFHQKLCLTPVLGTLMAEKIAYYYKNYSYPEYIIPMPIHFKRLRERGYHQVHELAKILSRQLSIPIALKACQRIQHTPPQSSLPFKQRKDNVRKIFKANKIPYQHIAIVDDVITSGETISSLCHALKKENPDLFIDVWCLARTKPS
jgi:ComF family protein